MAGTVLWLQAAGPACWHVPSEGRLTVHPAALQSQREHRAMFEPCSVMIQDVHATQQTAGGAAIKTTAVT